MDLNQMLRVVGVAALVVFGLLAAVYGISRETLVVLVLALVGIISPEALDSLPFGPNK